MLGIDVVWTPEHYVNGNYFQHEVNKAFRKNFSVEPFGTILDIGCGDGQYSNLLAKTMKHAHFLGIDNSEDMIRHANQHWKRKNLSFEVHNIEEFHSTTAFDFALSFWCLHWTDIELSLPAVFNALKAGGRMYAVFSSSSDNSIMQTWRILAKQNRYTDLTAKYFKANKTYIHQVINILHNLPFKQIKLNVKTVNVYFPTIDCFKNLLLTMPFMKSFPEEIIEDFIEDMLLTFQTICQRKYEGKLYYETRPIFVEALK